MSAPESKKNEPRFSHQSACTHGWTLKSYDRQQNINLPINLKLGPPIKINSPAIFVKPPRGILVICLFEAHHDFTIH